MKGDTSRRRARKTRRSDTRSDSDARRSQRRSDVLAFGAFSIFALCVHANLVPRVADVDSFYHLRHSWVYRVYGMFDSSFPWAQFSTVKTHAADLWYGFHILTIPLTYFDPLTTGLYVGGVLVTIAALSLVYVALRSLEVPWPAFWVFVLALINPDVLYRLTMLRPHPLSLGLVLLLFAAMVVPPHRRSLAAVFALAALFSWNHVVIFWLPILVVGVVTAVRLLHWQPPDWGRLGAFGAGLALGVLLRPNPIGGLRLTSSVLEMMLVERRDVPLEIGRELYPFLWEHFIAFFVPLSLLLVVALGVLGLLLWRGRFIEIDRDRRIALLSSLALSMFFCVLTFAVARRAHELFVGFGVVFLALVLPHWRSASRIAASLNSAPRILGTLAPAAWRTWFAHVPASTRALLCVAIVAAVLVTGRHLQLFGQILGNTFHPVKFELIGKWLEENVEPGAVVFHPHWDRFGELFFWGPSHFYINGMDPIFHYRFDERSYWRTFYLAKDVDGETTCGSFPCDPEEIVSTYDALKHGFGASWIVIEMDRTPKLYQALLTMPGFKRTLENDGNVALFGID